MHIRTFTCSADARAAGYTTGDWLRAFTYAEHRERIRREIQARKKDQENE